jgi:hypothetical protein
MPSSPGAGGHSPWAIISASATHLVFRFKLGALEASVQIFAATGVHRTFPQPAAA